MLAGTPMMICGGDRILLEKALLIVVYVRLFIVHGKRLRMRSHSYLVKVD